jgi:hypothetical protein
MLSSILIPLASTAAQDSSQSITADQIDAAFAVEWMSLLYQRVESETVSAPAASRIYAYAGITLYESILPGMPANNALSGQVNGMLDMPIPDDASSYDWPSSANAALATVLTSLLPSDASVKAFTSLRASQVAAREAAVGADIVKRSLGYGDLVGKAILNWVAKDNFQETRTMTYKVPDEKAENWMLTTAGTKAVEPYWGQIRPFALESSDRCNIPLNMWFDTDAASTFYAQALEVKTVRDNLTKEQKEIADFWVDTPVSRARPVGTGYPSSTN